MCVDVKAIYIKDGINEEIITVRINTNACAWLEDPESTVSNFERLIKDEFFKTEKSTFWDVQIEPGTDFVAVILPGKYIAINTSTMSTACSNMSKNTRKKWKRRIIELIERSRK